MPIPSSRSPAVVCSQSDWDITDPWESFRYSTVAMQDVLTILLNSNKTTGRREPGRAGGVPRC